VREELVGLLVEDGLDDDGRAEGPNFEGQFLHLLLFWPPLSAALDQNKAGHCEQLLVLGKSCPNVHRPIFSQLKQFICLLISDFLLN